MSTALQQTCDDMLHAQYQQQRLLGFERAMHHDKGPFLPSTRMGLRNAMATQANELLRCRSILATLFTAANDEPMPGAAA